MAVTDEAIEKIRRLIQSGQLRPGSRLPPEQELAGQLGLSRSSMREAVKALVVARVLDVKRGDGTYVTSLEPRLLLEGFGFAIELLQDDTLLELLEVRRLLEPAATALAVPRITDDGLAKLRGHLADMRDARDDLELLVHHDTLFHATIVSASGNQTLSSILDGISSRTLRARIWRGIVEANAAPDTLAQHEAIYEAIAARNVSLAQASALIHASTSETWLRSILDLPVPTVPEPALTPSP
jgi:GntR family transcriptional repressor for pyruvate dehydrogenase complex